MDLDMANNHEPRGFLLGVLQEYGVANPLPQANWSLYCQSQSLVRFPGK